MSIPHILAYEEVETIMNNTKKKDFWLKIHNETFNKQDTELSGEMKLLLTIAYGDFVGTIRTPQMMGRRYG